MDCASRLEDIISRCTEKNINCIAVSDHGTIEGAVKLKSIAPFSVIIAEEILTPYGEIMGMFLSETIPSNSSVDETIMRIKDQNGLVCIPHPFDKMRPSALGSKVLNSIIDQIDIIEVFNARNHTPGGNSKAEKVAREHGKLRSAGSDAHHIEEIGNVFIEMPEFNNADEFKLSLNEGIINGHSSSPFVHFISTKNKIMKRFSSR
jgi:predicted metal-dependent phosphoesterase TrpH